MDRREKDPAGRTLAENGFLNSKERKWLTKRRIQREDQHQTLTDKTPVYSEKTEIKTKGLHSLCFHSFLLCENHILVFRKPEWKHG